jgi:hypothetical protein
MRFRIAALLAILFALAAVPTATADKPLKLPVVFGSLTLDGVCDFPVLIEAVGPQNQKIITFSDGRQVINGQLFARVTNLDRPSNTWEGTASGPIFVTPNPDGTLSVKGTGINLWYFFPGDVSEGAPGALYWVRGLSEEILDANGVPVPGTFVHHGAIENLCETLA